MQEDTQPPVAGAGNINLEGLESTPTGQFVPLPGAPTPLARYREVMRLFRNRKVLIGGLILLFFAALAILAPVLAPGDPTRLAGVPNQPPSSQYLLGTGGQGQDIFAQTVWGARGSLTAGLLVGLLTTAVAVLIGLSAAYFGGWVDDLLSLLMNVFIVIPGLPLLVALAAFLPAGLLTIIFVLAFVGWAGAARVLRAQALSIRQKDYILSAVVIGESSVRIILRGILPNMLSIVTGVLLGSIVYGIAAQAGLEFLGLGKSSSVDWGTNLFWASNNNALLVGTWWTFVPSGLSIALAAFALALLNYAMDELTNPRLRAEKETADVLKKVPRAAARATPVVKQAG